jgi:hypothetical protein
MMYSPVSPSLYLSVSYIYVRILLGRILDLLLPFPRDARAILYLL